MLFRHNEIATGATASTSGTVGSLPAAPIGSQNRPYFGDGI